VSMKELLRRPLDLALVVFFLVNVFVITYQVDLEQLVIADPANFTYPLWPPRFSVDAVHWWGQNFDPVLLRRPVWWKVTIWMDVLLYGPFYVVAVYALLRDRPWIRTPMVLWSGLMLMGVAVIMGEEMFGPYRTPAPLIIWLANAPWIVFPLLALWRAWRTRPRVRT
jgi:hypothetical protein